GEDARARAVVAARRHRSRCPAADGLRREARALPARHRMAVPRQARRVRRSAGLDLLPPDTEDPHDLVRGVLERGARHGSPPRGGAVAEDPRLATVHRAARPRRAGRAARRLDGGGAPLPRTLGVEIAALRVLVTAAVAGDHQSGSPSARASAWKACWRRRVSTPGVPSPMRRPSTSMTGMTSAPA